MKECPRCKRPLLESHANECQHCGFVFEKTRFRKPRTLTLILVSAAAILLIAYLVAPEKLADIVHVSKRVQDRTQVREDQDHNPKVKSKDIYQVFLDQYCVRPDTRFVKAFKIIVDLYNKYHEIPEEQNPFRIGNIKLDENIVVVPIVKKGEIVKNIQLPVSMTFTEVMHALEQCLQTIEEEKRLSTANPQRDIYWLDQYKTALRSFHMVDPRTIIEGLLELEKLKRGQGPDSRLILAASRGYALLYASLYPDYMQYGDDFASYALGYLALTRHIDPKLPSTIEEAFVAMNMGYTAHAQRLLKNIDFESAKPIDKVFDAYMRKDFSALKELQGEGSRVLGYYLLARLYRESGLYREAENVANGLVNRFTNHYPTIVELFILRI